MLETVMGNQKVLGFKISEISELARMEFEKKKNSTRNHLGKPDKKNNRVCFTTVERAREIFEK
jgi:hypothetical protein